MPEYIINMRTGQVTVRRKGQPDQSLAQPLVAGRPQCKHLGKETGQRRICPTCQGHVEVKLYECGVFGECTTHKPIEGLACCAPAARCPAYQPVFSEVPAVVG